MHRTLRPMPSPSLTTGATSELHHHAALVERHWITAPLPRRPSEYRRKALIAQALTAAEPLLAEAGLPAGAAEAWTRPGEIGVSWTVVVGEVHTVTGERDPYWVWSSRWRYWRDRLAAVVASR
jgi:hypothetical protein